MSTTINNKNIFSRLFSKTLPEPEEKTATLSKAEYKEAQNKIKSILKEHKNTIRAHGVPAVIQVLATLADKLSRDENGNFKPGWAYTYLTTNVLSGASAELLENYILRKQVEINNQIQTSLHNEYDSQPIAERNKRNPDTVINEQSAMKVAVNGYIGSKGQLIGNILSSSVMLGLTATTGGTASLALMGGVIAYSALYSHLVNKRLNKQKITIKNSLRDQESDIKGTIRHMVANSVDREINDPQKKEYNILNKKQSSYENIYKKFAHMLSRYAIVGTVAKAAMIGTVAALTWGNPTNLLVTTGAALGTYVAVQKCINSLYSIKEHVSNFGNTYKKFRSNIKEISFGKQKIPEKSDTIILDNIAFKHRSQEDINTRNTQNLFTSNETFVIDKGITVLSGASGAGKSTLINLLMHSDDVTNGSIQIGKTDANGNFQGTQYTNLAFAEPAHYYSVALQGTEFPEMSVRDFITMANPNASEELIKKVMSVTNIKDDPTDNSAISPNRQLFPSDNSISEGQKKRLNLARALIKDSPILILDEPTSGVDETNRTKIVAYLNELKDEKTIIYITHSQNDIKELDAKQAIDVAKLSPDALYSTIQKYDLTNPQIKEEFIKMFANRKSPSNKTKTPEREDDKTKPTFQETIKSFMQKHNLSSQDMIEIITPLTEDPHIKETLQTIIEKELHQNEPAPETTPENKHSPVIADTKNKQETTTHSGTNQIPLNMILDKGKKR